MAYLNCPKCPAQAFLVKNADHLDLFINKDIGLEKYRCPSKHVFYVEAEETHEGH